MTTKLVIFSTHYTDDQLGYNEAAKAFNVNIVDIDEASYSAMYNVQQSIQSTCTCLGGSVFIGLVRDGSYISLSVIEDTELDPDLDYGDLENAFKIGLANLERKQKHLAELRSNVDLSLMYLSAGLKAGDEKRTVDHCILTLNNNRGHKTPIK